MIFFLAFLTFISSPGPKIKIENAWVRPAAAGMNSALYFNMTNESTLADTLYKVTSASAELVQLHESINDNGLMQMKEVKSVAVGGKQTVKFAPGGYHVMLIKLKRDLKVGQKINFYFYFKRAGRIRISAEVQLD